MKKRILFVSSKRYLATMPKKQKEKKISDVSQPTSSTQDSPISQTNSGHYLLKIIAKPGSKYNNITDITPEGVNVQIAAPPVDGEANTELIKYLASVLGLRKSDVTLEKGSKARQKTVALCCNISSDEIMKKLSDEKSKLT